MDEQRAACRFRITGVVQGVGFRPFVFALAARYRLVGWVRNTSAGVEIEVEGRPDVLDSFAGDLQTQAPPLASIDRFEREPIPWQGHTRFEIHHSAAIPGAFQPISPDVSTCDDCLLELFDPADRRFGYPFINCTNCGPRFTIIQDIPYDRALTTMAAFALCDACREEYQNPADRRFHAQPVACAACGPRVWLEADGTILARDQEAIRLTRQSIAAGKIVAIKGLGGFHLACDARSPDAVQELRRRKLRVDKAFALMMPDLQTVEQHCLLDDGDRELLNGRRRPIVILPRRQGSDIAEDTAPGQKTLGVMLPYTPLHHLLFRGAADLTPVLVMTSANLSEEPIASENEDARRRLASLADLLLMHDRPIQNRCDDSVVLSLGPPESSPYLLRRARGYAPSPITLKQNVPPLLAAGAELKNTFCLARDQRAILSHHIGDLQNIETLQSYQTSISLLERLFRIEPQVIAYDLHPDYLATRYALERAQQQGLAAYGIQHHHAHLAACLADNQHPGDRAVIGVIFDGTGFGSDATIWGGEFLIGDYQNFSRPLHLAPIRLAGGEAAVRHPWRLALAWLRHAGLAWQTQLPALQGRSTEELSILDQLLQSGLNSPLTSSMGRLFDAVASLIGIRQHANYEAQAAIELEACCDPHASGAYSFAIEGAIIDPAPLIRQLVEEVKRGEIPPVLSSRFHQAVINMVHEVCLRIRAQSDIQEVALSGGVWQNMVLLEGSMRRLKSAGFSVIIHQEVPANDGGLSLGQAVIAAERQRAGLAPEFLTAGSPRS